MFVKLWADKRLRADDSAARELERVGRVALPKDSVTFSEHWIEKNSAAANPVNDVLFKQLLNQLEREIVARRKKRIFGRDESIRLRPSTILRVVEKLQHYDMFGIDEDLNGRLFETFLSATMRGRELGQFFTPRSIVKLMVRLAELKASREHIDKVVDACCGTGGFLIEALSDMRNKVRGNRSLSSAEKDRLLTRVANESIYGIDFGKNPPLARIARMNMYLHGDGGSRIYFADALDKQALPTEGEDPETLQEQEELRAALNDDLQFDVALTNPPFSMTRSASKKDDERVLKQYKLAKVSDSSTQIRASLRSSLMFVERYHDMLRPGGLLISVLDDTILASGKFAFFREVVRRFFIVRSIISLPGDAFRRQGSRVKCSVLVLQKKSSPDEEQPEAFGAFSLELGVDDLTPRASDADIQDARAKAEAEIQRIVNEYEAFMAGRPSGIMIPAERLTDRLDLKHCIGDRGRLVPQWRRQGIEVKTLLQLVTEGVFNVVEETIDPQGFQNDTFKLLGVTYEGECRVDNIRQGHNIKAEAMFQVQTNDLVISKIRVTDGATGIVTDEFNQGLVSSTSYIVLRGRSLVDTIYLRSVLRSHEIRADLAAVSTGTNRYVTSWEEAQKVELPWLNEEGRQKVADVLIQKWRLDSELKRQEDALHKQVAALGLESEESVARFRASKAPQ